MLAYRDPTHVDGPELLATRTFHDELVAELTATGELLATDGLAHPSLARTVRREDGGAVALDGPYAATKEVLAGYTVLDCAGLDRAMSLAARVAVATGDTVEVRPIAATPDQGRV
jgi:hypothetical protein